MLVHLTDEQEEFVQRAIASGRYVTAEDAVSDALEQWVENQRRLFELLSSLDEADADIAAGRYTEYTDETLHELAAEVKAEGRRARALMRS